MTDSWDQMPQDGGQTVDVKHAVNWEARRLLRRTEDRSSGGVTLEVGKIAIGEDVYEPWNGVVPRVTEWIAQQTEEVSDD